MLQTKATIMDGQGVELAIKRISFEIIERNRGLDDICLVGVYTRGVTIAWRMAATMETMEKQQVPVGCLDISPFRDDRSPSASGQDRTDIPFDLTGKKVILVDDVVHTGRTVRAAIDAILYRGRPKSIQLAVLVDRGHRELPIRADYIGRNVPTAKTETIRLQLIPVDQEDSVVICENR